MPRGQPLITMNPFSNNKPRLTASERIRNKRDATIYQGEKLKFQQGKKKCRSRNVKFYKNGKVRSVVNYKMQKSLSRGNVLCNDCDDKGNLCAAPSKKDDLATIYMGNNNYSEFWGGGSVLNWAGGQPVRQTTADVVINSDVSGSWDPSSNSWKGDISKCGPSGNLVCPYGYLNNLIKIPRNLDGSGVIIDPSNLLFPDELCDPFRYLKKSYLKTYIVITSGLAITKIAGTGSPFDYWPSRCDDLVNEILVGDAAVAQHADDGATTAFGVISSVCCIGGIPKMIADGPWGTISYANNTTTDYSLPPTNFGLYRIYIEVADINLKRFSKAMKIRNELSFRPWYATPPGTPLGTVPPGSNLYDDDMIINITEGGVGWGDAVLWPWLMQSINIIQGSIPPSQNQTKYNATLQSYMSCLENGTNKIKFTKQNTRLPVKNSFCKSVVSD